uniref:Odorant receptor n=1 Tax=Adelphocoris lineolatus TaxID=236346 RepID=A0A2I4PHK3_ADELI|nr:olfactory receptor 34 [Adelphocoris lineolatus]
MQTEGDKIVQPLIDALKFGGLWFDFSDHKYGEALKWCNIIRNAIAFLVWGIITGYFFIGGLSFLLTESGVFMPISFDEGCMSIIVICNLPAVRNVIQIYNKRFDSFSSIPWARSIIDEEMNKFNKIFQLPKTALVVFYCLYSIAPLMYDGYRACVGNENPYVVSLPLNFLLELPMRRTPTFFLTVYLANIYFLIIVPRFIAFEALVLYMVAFVVIDVKIFIRKMEKLSENDDGTEFIQKAWNLKDVTLHHSSIVCVVRDHFPLLGFAILLQNVSNSISSCLVIYLMKTSYNNGDIILAIFCGNFFVILMVINLMFNGAGVIIENQGELLLAAIYNTGWYKQPPSVRKEVNFMLMQGLKLLKISYKLNSVNLEAAMLVMNRAYSFFTLINTGE